MRRGGRGKVDSLVLPGMERAVLPAAGPMRPGARAAVRSSREAVGPPSPLPWDCVVLGVDTANHSGWAVLAGGKYVQSGELDTRDRDAVRRVVAAALQIAEVAALPCVLVLEKPWGGSVNVVAALGAARERWVSAWDVLAVAAGHKGKVIRVVPSTWRSAVLGRGAGGLRREVVRSREQMAAAVVKGCDADLVGGDEAAAILIARWGAHAFEVGAVVGKRVVKRSLAALGGQS